jgi:hypothetical protein
VIRLALSLSQGRRNIRAAIGDQLADRRADFFISRQLVL